MALPVIDPAGIAEVAAAALREDGHAGRTYELTGPEAISPRGQAAVISEALGEEVALVELSREEAHARMARFMPEEVIDGTLDVLGVPLPAEQKTSPDVERILRRPARSFGAWVARNLPAFRWSPPWGARKTPPPPQDGRPDRSRITPTDPGRKRTICRTRPPRDDGATDHPAAGRG